MIKIKPEYIKRNVAGEDIVVPTGSAVAEHNGIFVLTETGAVIWDLILGGADENGIAEKIAEEFDVDILTAKRDVSAFLGKMKEFGIIE